MPSSSIHVAANGKNLFFMAEQYSIIDTHTPHLYLPIYLLVDTGCFHILSTVNNVSRNFEFLHLFPTLSESEGQIGWKKGSRNQVSPMEASKVLQEIRKSRDTQKESQCLHGTFNLCQPADSRVTEGSSGGQHCPLLVSESESEASKSYLTLCDPMSCGPPGSSIHGIFQARVLEWVAISSSRGSS